MSAGKKMVWTLVSLAVLAGVAAVVWSRMDKGTPAPMAYPPVKVALAEVHSGQSPRVYLAIGALEASRQVQVAAEVAGRVTEIRFESGQSVKAGQLLVQLNDAPEQAQLRHLRAQLLNAQTVYARTSRLRADNAATQEQLDQALAARDMAAAQVQHAQALIAQKAILAPFAGVVGIRRVHQGQYLQAAQAVASLVDARSLYVNFSLDEQSRPGLQLGQAVQVQVDAYPQRSFSARLSAIDPVIGESRNLQAQARLDNGQGLLQAGMYTSVQVARPHAEQVLTVPETAITYTAYGDTVFRIRNAHEQPWVVERVAVKVGQRHAGRVEIEQGLSAGEQVVTSGQLKLSDGMQVEALAQDSLQLPLAQAFAPGA